MAYPALRYVRVKVELYPHRNVFFVCQEAAYALLGTFAFTYALRYGLVC